MKKNKKLLMVSATICFVAFTAFSQTVQSDSLAKQIIGEWENTYVKVTIHHEGNQPQIMEADSSNWEARLGIKPIRTRFKEDGTYYSEYRNLKDSVVQKVTGLWSIKGDSITMDRRMPDKSIYTLHLIINKNVATFDGLIDFEGNGKSDDEYFGRQRKFK